MANLSWCLRYDGWLHEMLLSHAEWLPEMLCREEWLHDTLLGVTHIHLKVNRSTTLHITTAAIQNNSSSNTGQQERYYCTGNYRPYIFDCK